MVEAVISNSYLSNMQYTPGRGCNNRFYQSQSGYEWNVIRMHHLWCGVQYGSQCEPARCTAPQYLCGLRWVLRGDRLAARSHPFDPLTFCTERPAHCTTYFA